jgi:uncharacterized protein YecE (DUF72 family)
MIQVGTSGYGYDDWRGPFYPARLPKKDYLDYYVQHFRCVELNSSYYAIPSPTLIRNLAEHTPDNFRVAVKAYKGVTHERSADPDSEMRRFLAAIEPLAGCGKLACVLLQFPHSFAPGQPQMDLIARLAAMVQPAAPVVEFRNARWMTPEVWAWLRKLDIALCCVDEPRIEGLLPPETVMTSPRVGYVRFHGRNSEKWYGHAHPDERYDYMYSDDELLEWKKGITWLGRQCEQAYVFFNNHRNGQAVRNAGMLQKLLGLEELPNANERQQLLL